MPAKAGIQRQPAALCDLDTNLRWYERGSKPPRLSVSALSRDPITRCDQIDRQADDDRHGQAGPGLGSRRL
jgi:hypothetical protein